MKFSSSLLSAIITAGLLLQSVCVEASPVTSVGTKSIILPASPSDTERFAATELQRYLEQILGEHLVIVTEDEPADGYRFYIGRTKPGNTVAARADHPIVDIRADSFVIDTDADRTILVGGGDRGTLYAVYDLLEGEGCRWYEPGPIGEVVPQRDELSLAEGMRVERPVFAMREIAMSAPDAEDKALEKIDWYVKNRLNHWYDMRPARLARSENKDLRDAWKKRGGMVEWQHICHNTPLMFPNAKYYSEHPEYYSLYRGNRIQIGTEAGYLCTQNPDVQQIAAQFISNWFSTHPQGSAVPVSPPDGALKWCECDLCMSLGGINFMNGPKGHMTRRQVEFINAIARQVAKTHPDRYVVNLAYSRYVWPFDGMRQESNIIVQVAHGYAGNGSMVHPITSHWNDEAREIFQQWATSGAGGIGIWDYFLLQAPGAGSPLTPLGFGNVAHSMISFLSDFSNPYKVYFTQAGNELQKSNPFMYYLVARLTWDPTQPLDDVRTDYARGMFGSAAKPVADYLALLDEAYEQSDWNPPNWLQIMVPSPKVFTPAFFDRALSLLARAEHLIPDQDSRAAQALARIRRSVSYAELSVLPKQLISDGTLNWRLERGENAYILNAGSTPDPSIKIADIRARAVEANLLDETMERAIFRCETRAENILWLENERLRVGILPGIGGRIIRLIDKRYEQNLLYEPMTVNTLSDPGAGYFRYGGYEEYTRKAYASPGWEMPMTAHLVDADGGQSVNLEGLTREQVLVNRQITIQPGDDPVVTIHTKLTNESAAPMRLNVRVHPEFKLGNSLDEVDMFLTTANGQEKKMPIRSVSTMSDHPPEGVWGVVHRETGMGVRNVFAPGSAETHLHFDYAHSSFNIELFGEEKNLAPGESLAFEHRYELLEKPDRPMAMPASPEAQPGALEQVVASDQDDSVEYVTGWMGQGGRPKATRRLTYPDVAAICDRAGTFMTWVKLDHAPAGYTEGPLMSFGTKQPDYSMLAVSDGMLRFLRHTGKPPYTGDDEAWCKAEAPLQDWAPGSWHHIAVVWSHDPVRGRDGIVQLYVDGQQVEARYDARLLPLTGSPGLAIGWRSAKAEAPVLAGVLDEVRLYNQALLRKEIQAQYQADLRGEIETGGLQPVLRLAFEGTTSSDVESAENVSTPAEQARRHRLLIEQAGEGSK